MYLTEKKRAVLQILADNVAANRCPEPVNSERIAEQLEIGLPELVGMLKNLDESGMIVTCVEHRRSIITKDGLARLYGRADAENISGNCAVAV